MTDDEMNRRFEGLAESIHNVKERLEELLETRPKAIEGHLDRIDSRLTALEFPIPALQRAMDRMDKSQREMLAVQQKQQQAIDDLYRRMNPPPAA